MRVLQLCRGRLAGSSGTCVVWFLRERDLDEGWGYESWAVWFFLEGATRGIGVGWDEMRVMGLR